MAYFTMPEGEMARIEIKLLEIQEAGVRKRLQQASKISGEQYELTLGGCISKRQIPVLEMIEAETGIPVVGASMERTRGRDSSQSQAWFQWQRGHRKDGIRWPDATIEFVGSGGEINRVYALEISLQTDFTKIGDSLTCSMSMAKASQIAWTAAGPASKPTYRSADIRYWYFCPWEPTQDFAQ